MNKLGRNKTNWLIKQECRFEKDPTIDPTSEEESTRIVTKYNEYVGLADLGKKAYTVNFIYRHRLTNLMCINRAKGLPLSQHGCNAVSIGFNETEQAWYGWTHRGYGKFYIGYEVTKGSIMDHKPHEYPYKVETLEQAKQLAIDIAEYLD